MKQIIIFILALFATGSAAQMELIHGPLAGVGKGSISGAKYAVSDNVWQGITKIGLAESRYKYNALLGYKFRIKPLNGKSFFDMDLTFGEKKTGYLIQPDLTELWESLQPGTKVSFIYGENRSYGISLALGYSYRLYRGLYVGAGIAPGYRYRTEGTRPLFKNKFDAPLFVKAGYDFGFMDISFSYWMGMTNMLENDYIKGGKVNDWQMQLFVPLLR